jgi:hypothetical protein
LLLCEEFKKKFISEAGKLWKMCLNARTEGVFDLPFEEKAV